MLEWTGEELQLITRDTFSLTFSLSHDCFLKNRDSSRRHRNCQGIVDFPGPLLVKPWTSETFALILRFAHSWICVLWLCSPEEILQTHIAHWWSPDGLRLAYMTINDTLVPRMEVPFFTGRPYPTSLDYHYPKASSQHKPSHLFYNMTKSEWLWFAFLGRKWQSNYNIIDGL